MEEAGTKLTEHSIRSVHRVFPEKKKVGGRERGEKNSTGLSSSCTLKSARTTRVVFGARISTSFPSSSTENCVLFLST